MWSKMTPALVAALVLAGCASDYRSRYYDDGYYGRSYYGDSGRRYSDYRSDYRRGYDDRYYDRYNRYDYRRRW